MVPPAARKRAPRALKWAVASAVAVSLVAVLVLVASTHPAPAVLANSEIGENEAAFSEKDQQAVEETYDAAMPFRDPGHISRDQIRFDKALQAEGVVAHGKGWSWKKPLWGNYHHAMKDPATAHIGWTEGREANPDATPMQRAMEQYAYGSEGHRQPEIGWAPGVDVHYDPDQDRWSDEGMPAEKRPSDAGLSALEKQMAVLSQGMADLKEQRPSPAKSADVKRDLTYKVLRDKLVHSRLQAEVAAAKERDAESRGETELRSQMQRLRAIKEEEENSMSSMRGKVDSLRGEVTKLSRGRRSRGMSDRGARRDLNAYFKQLERDTHHGSRSSARSSQRSSLARAAPTPPAARDARAGGEDAAEAEARRMVAAQRGASGWSAGSGGRGASAMRQEQGGRGRGGAERGERAGRFKHMRLEAEQGQMMKLADVRSAVTEERKGDELSQLIHTLARSNNAAPYLPGFK